MRYVLHIGTNKTGTSTLQHYLGSHRDELSKQGIRYPKLAGHQYAHHSVALGIKAGNFEEQGIDPGAFTSRDDAVTLLSSEAFHTIQDVASVAKWFPPEETRVFLYLREHVAYLASWYQQAVQARTITCSFLDFAVVHAPSFATLVDRWRAVYGAHLHLGVYERARLKDQDIVADFFSVAFNRPPPVPRTFNDKNPTISGNLLFLKLFMNHFLTAEENARIVEELSTLCSVDARFSGKLQIDTKEARRVAHLFAADRKRLNGDFKLKLRPPKEGVDGNPSPDLRRLRDDLAALLAASKERNFAWHDVLKSKLELLLAAAR